MSPWPLNLDPGELGDMIVVAIPRAKSQIVLQRQRCDPEVVRGYRGALPPKLPIGRRVVMRRLVVGEENADPRFEQKPS